MRVALCLFAALGASSVAFAQAAPPTPIASPRATPASDIPVRVGPTYVVGGRSYTPVDVIDYDEVGYATVIAQPTRPDTASGEAYLAEAVSAGHRTLPLPSYAEVTRLDTGRTILVRINDRGPADPNALIELTPAAAAQLGLNGAGATAVRLRRTFPVEAERAALRAGRGVPTRIDTPESLLVILRERAAAMPRPGTAPTAAPVATPSSATARPPASPRTSASTAPRTPASTRPQPAPAASGATPAATALAPSEGGWVVQVGAFRNRTSAEQVARAVRGSVSVDGGLHRVRLGPFASRAQADRALASVRRDGRSGVILRLP